MNRQALKTMKCSGFSDRQIARYSGSSELVVRRKRQQLNLLPFRKQIDTLAAEFPAETNYLYMTYHGDEHDISEINVRKRTLSVSVGPAGGSSNHYYSPELVSSPRKSNGQNHSSYDKHQQDMGGVMVLGCGAYCIGSSVEFDWCAVSAVRQLRAMDDRVIVVNYNPETVSTDYDECDALYFEELTLERVLDIYELEKSVGIMVSVGGQIPNNLALPLHQLGARILGTSPASIDKAEDRHKFSALLDKIKVDQPTWKELTTVQEAHVFAEQVGYPVLVSN